MRQLKNALKEAKQSLENARANQKFRCACGKLHRISDCVAIEVQDYVEPYGCTGGDYYVYSELQVPCPNDDQLRNRFLYDTYWRIPWEKRDEYEYNTEEQFNRMYLDCFKERHREARNDRELLYRPPVKHVNNYYVDRNRKKFGISVKGIDQ